MLHDAAAKLFDVVLVYKLDRFTRSVKDLYTLLETFKKCGVGFRSSQEQFDTTTSMGRAMMGMLAIFAEWERDTIKERVYMGMEQKVLGGERNGSIAPLGYDLVDGKLVPNQDADLIRRIFAMYNGQRGTPSIIAELAQEGIIIPNSALYYILCNPVYCGKARWNHRSSGRRTGKDIIVSGSHEPLISEDEFNRAQNARGERHRGGKGKTSDFPFSGVAKCFLCGGDMVGASRAYPSSRYKFYRCSTRVNYNSCKMPHISEKAIDEAVMDFLSKKKTELAAAIIVPEIKKEKNESAEIERELAMIKSRIKRFQEAYGNGAMELDELKDKLEPDRKKEAELRRRLLEVPLVREPAFTKEEAIQQLKELSKVWKKLDDDMAKKGFIQYIFEKIVIKPLDLAPRKGRGYTNGVEILGIQVR